MRSRFYIDTSYLSPTELEEAYNKLPVEFKTALAIHEGEIEIGGFKQFLSFYGDKRLKYKCEQKQQAEDAFLLIFFDNRYMIEKIKHATALIPKLSQEENWVGINETLLDSKNEHTESHTQNNRDESTNSSKRSAATMNVASDSNSGGYIKLLESDSPSTEVGMVFPQCSEGPGITLQSKKIKYPINTIASDSATESDSSSSTSSSTGSSTSNVKNTVLSTSTTKYVHTSRNIQSYLDSSLPQLRREFGLRFSKLFLF